MKKNKNFDCVRMKWEIQQKILAETEGKSPEEVRSLRREQIEQDPLLGPFLKKLRKIDPSNPRRR